MAATSAQRGKAAAAAGVGNSVAPFRAASLPGFAASSSASSVARRCAETWRTSSRQASIERRTAIARLSSKSQPMKPVDVSSVTLS